MTEFLQNFSLDASSKLGWATYLCAILLWVATVYCGILSINQQPFNRAERMFWTTIIVCIPLAGMLAYLPKAWYNAATGALSFWKKPKKHKKFYGY